MEIIGVNMYLSLSMVNLSKELQAEEKCREAPLGASTFLGEAFGDNPKIVDCEVRMLRPYDSQIKTTPRRAGCCTLGIGRMMLTNLGAVRNHWGFDHKSPTTFQ